MICPKCNEVISIIDSRIREGAIKNSKTINISHGLLVRRRRACTGCGYRFTTHEITDDLLRVLIGDQARLKMLQNMFNGGDALKELPKRASPERLLEHFAKQRPL